MDTSKLIIAVLVFLAGFGLNGVIKNSEIKSLKNKQLVELNTAQAAKITAEKKTREAEQKVSSSLAKAATAFEEVRENDKANSNRVIADLRSDVTRLRVLVRRSPSNGGVPGTSTSASCGDDKAEQTLSGPVAARLAERYAEYNSLVDQLGLCQATVRADRELAK